MFQQIWIPDNRTYLVCIDSYEDGILTGWFCSPCRDVDRFSSLTQFLLKMEALLDRNQTPQAYTTPRRFAEPEISLCDSIAVVPRGAKATFDLKIIFRQHTSWQGILVWREKKLEHSFRSVLELVILLDSALRNTEDSDVA